MWHKNGNCRVTGEVRKIEINFIEYFSIFWAFSSAEEQKSAREFSHGLDFTIVVKNSITIMSLAFQCYLKKIINVLIFQGIVLESILRRIKAFLGNP
jgi:hypothetical protein